jgi:hypothetical protein
MEQATLLHAKSQLIGRHDLRDLPTPPATATHFPIPHASIVETLAETLAFRHFSIAAEEYAVSHDGLRFFGVLTLDVEESGVRLAIGLRNSHDKSFSLALTVGRRVLVCDNLALYGDYSPLLRKHTKHVEIDSIMSIAVDQMQRNFEPMKRQIAFFRGCDLSDQRAKLIIYDAFLGGAADLPKHLGSVVHDHYFNPRYPEFEPRTLWSLENAFTSAVKELEPISRLRAIGRMAPFLGGLGSSARLVDGIASTEMNAPPLAIVAGMGEA